MKKNFTVIFFLVIMHTTIQTAYAWDVEDFLSENFSTFREFKRDMSDETVSWVRDKQCPTLGGFVPTNEADAFGHCWAGCRVDEICYGLDDCAILGYVRELAREFDDDEHDSFFQDVQNQTLGRKVSNQGESCSTVCETLVSAGALDFSAPKRKWIDCQILKDEGRFELRDAPCLSLQRISEKAIEISTASHHAPLSGATGGFGALGQALSGALSKVTCEVALLNFERERNNRYSTPETRQQLFEACNIEDETIICEE